MKNRIKFLAVAATLIAFTLINESLEIVQVAKISNAHHNSAGELEYSDEGYALTIGKVELASVVLTKNMNCNKK